MSREPFETMPDVMDAKQLAQALQISKPKSVKTRSRAGKVTNQPIARAGTYSASFEAFLSKKCTAFPIQELRKITKNRRFYENRTY